MVLGFWSSYSASLDSRRPLWSARYDDDGVQLEES